jgi:hypothetical protein
MTKFFLKRYELKQLLKLQHPNHFLLIFHYYSLFRQMPDLKNFIPSKAGRTQKRSRFSLILYDMIWKAKYINIKLCLFMNKELHLNVHWSTRTPFFPSKWNLRFHFFCVLHFFFHLAFSPGTSKTRTGGESESSEIKTASTQSTTRLRRQPQVR